MSYTEYSFGEIQFHEEYLNTKDGFIKIENYNDYKNYIGTKMHCDVEFDTIDPDNGSIVYNHVYYIVEDSDRARNESWWNLRKRIWYKFHQMYPNLISM